MNTIIDSVTIRKANSSDATVIVHLVRLLVTEMEAIGAHAVAAGSDAWSRIEDSAPDRICDEDRMYLLAERGSVEIGFGEGKVGSTIPVFASKMILHIGSVYVTPEYRDRGIGRQIVEKLLNWGRDRGCSEVELNVLVGNPARKFYRRLGFGGFEVTMTREL